MAKGNDYKSCSELARSNPAEALRSAEREIQKYDKAGDLHCRAMALYNLERYEEAAMSLQRLASRVQRQNRVLWVQVLRQAGKAWHKQQQSELALKAIEEPIAWLMPLAWEQESMRKLLVELLIQRAQIYDEIGKSFVALQDLDHALSLIPQQLDALLIRASIYAELGERGAANADIENVLLIRPNHVQAIALQKKISN